MRATIYIVFFLCSICVCVCCVFFSEGERGSSERGKTVCDRQTTTSHGFLKFFGRIAYMRSPRLGPRRCFSRCCSPLLRARRNQVFLCCVCAVSLVGGFEPSLIRALHLFPSQTVVASHVSQGLPPTVHVYNMRSRVHLTAARGTLQGMMVHEQRLRERASCGLTACRLLVQFVSGGFYRICVQLLAAAPFWPSGNRPSHVLL